MGAFEFVAGYGEKYAAEPADAAGSAFVAPAGDFCQNGMADSEKKVRKKRMAT